jgi:hypothetical protein
MESQGNIKLFDSPELAKQAGFDTELTDDEVKVLTPIPPELRHAFLRRLRAEARAKAAGKSKRREKNRAARKTRRLQRNR